MSFAPRLDTNGGFIPNRVKRVPYHVYFTEKYQMNYNCRTKQEKLNEYRRIGKILKNLYETNE